MARRMTDDAPIFLAYPRKAPNDPPRSATGSHPRGERKNVSTRKTLAKRKIESLPGAIGADPGQPPRSAIEPPDLLDPNPNGHHRPPGGNGGT